MTRAFLASDYQQLAKKEKARADHLRKMIDDAIEIVHATDLGSKAKRLELVLSILATTVSVDELFNAVEEQK